MCKTEKIKEETTKKIRETNGGQWDILLLSRIFFRFSFACYNISICKKEKLKHETSKKIREIDGGQIKEQDVPLTYSDNSIKNTVLMQFRQF